MRWKGMRVAGLSSVFLAACLAVSAQGQTNLAERGNSLGLKGGVLVKGSTSPDGRFALFEYHPTDGGMETTNSAIAIAPVDRSRWLSDIDSVTKWMTDKEVPSFLTFQWNSKSRFLATHDTTKLHSATRIYRVEEDKVTSLEVPDLLTIVCQKLKIERSKVAASGQIPAAWSADDVLGVTIRMTVGSRKISEKVRLKVADDGTVSVN